LSSGTRPSGSDRWEVSVEVKDPVCGMTIEDSDAVATVEYGGKTYYFCSTDCAASFEEDPEDYI
jgi:YHS domain-containing protein